ncbi:MAG: NAD(P)H-hydrate dehydratase [Deltaproteobacteria bacterium]|nr:NAD(P)H-hydrate dehydratase [Deltaproteobacteria bacterium]
MRIVDSVIMRRLDETAIKKYGIPGLVLMENAGRGVAQIVKRDFDGGCRGDSVNRPILGDPLDLPYKNKRISIFAGKGNNGGDGFVAARHLSNMGFKVSVYLLANPKEVKGDAKTNLDIWEKMGGETKSIVSAKDIEKYKSAILHSALIVDAIFGTGLSAEVDGIHRNVIELINGINKPVVAVDVPSGLDASNGRVLGCCVKAAVTAAMAIAKIGIFVYPGADYAGRVEIVDIGMPQQLLEDEKILWELLDKEGIKKILKPRKENSHKGSYGHVFVLAGSAGKTGAAAMTSCGAMRSGAGLVSLGIPKSLNPIMEQKLTEVMTLPLAESSSGILAYEAFEDILSFAVDKEALVLGPGLTTHESVRKLVINLISRSPIPLVVDADGINCLAQDVKVFKKAKAHIVITPHPGEMARLAGMTTKDVQADRIGIASRFARENKVIVVLKGARTVIAEASGKVFINPTGNPGMATAGTGDVLAGMIGGFIAQGYSPIDAANMAVYLHGMAGDEVAKKKGQIGMMATDILDVLPQTISSFY